jgi:Mrp family chromosome partitioning ATPase
MVLLDTPPMLPMTDARVLGRMTEQTFSIHI